MLAMEKGYPYAHDGSETPRSHFDKFEVILDPQDDPQELPILRKWLIVFTISFSSLCVACASSAVRHLSFVLSLRHRGIDLGRRTFLCSNQQAAFTEAGVASEFGVSREVTILAVTLYTLGLALGPLLVGPLSEVLVSVPVRLP